LSEFMIEVLLEGSFESFPAEWASKNASCRVPPHAVKFDSYNGDWGVFIP